MALSRTHPLFQSDKVTLSKEAASLIANTVECRIKQVIQMAHRFMFKSCRYVEKKPALLPSDVRDALRTLRMENLDGYSNCYDYRYVISSKLYKGNRVVKCESTLKNSMDDRCWGRQKLTDIVARDMQKAIPAQPGLSVHWMLVNGNVPALASNMAVCITDEFNREAKRQMVEMSMENVNFLNSDDASKQLEEIERFSAKIKLPTALGTTIASTSILEKSIVDSLKLHLTGSNEGPVDKNVEDKASIMPKIVIPKVEHVLTKEQRFFLKEIKNTVKRASVSMEHQAQVQLGKVLSILRNSPALDQLLPELTAFFVSELQRSTGDMEAILKFAEALSANSHIQLHFHVHQLVAPLLNMALKHDEDQNLQTVHNNLCLRKIAAKTLGNIANNLRYSKKGLEGIDPYLMTLYKRAIVDDKCSITVLYGAMCGISHLPLGARRIIFFPLVPLIMSALYKKHILAYEKHSATGSKVEEFKFVTCQEILHMAMLMLYDACFEDVLESVQDTGVFSISHEAQVMIQETLSGCMERVVNPEGFLPIYIAILSRCFGVLKPEKAKEEKKIASQRLPELEIADFYAKIEEERAGKRRRTIQVDKAKGNSTNQGSAVELVEAPWYIGQAINSMTLTI